MNMPVMKLSQRDVALRIRENRFDVLQTYLDDLVLDRNFPLQINKIIECLQASLTKRQGFIPFESPEHVNIQQDVNVLEALKEHMNLNHETDGLRQRAEKLEDLKISVSKIGISV